MTHLEIHYINLDRSPDRRLRIEGRLTAAGLVANRITGVDGEHIRQGPSQVYEPQDAIRATGRQLLAGELGCYLSHVHALNLTANSASAWVLVLEDDAAVPPDAAERLNLLMTLLPDEVGVVNLARRPRHDQTLLDVTTGLVRAHYFPVTTTALLWRPAAARSFSTSVRPIRYPIDVQLQIWATEKNVGAALLEPLMPSDRSQSVVYTGMRSNLEVRTLAHQYKRLLKNRLKAWKHRRQQK